MESNSTEGSFLDKHDFDSLSAVVVDWLMTVTLAFVGSTTIYLNIIVIIGFVKEKTIRQIPGNVFILNLAISDFLTGIFVCYVAVLGLYRYKNYYEYLFQMGFMCGFYLSSSLFLNFLTVDRYLKVIMHLRYLAVMTTRKHLLLCSGIWVVCVVLGLSPLLGWHRPVVNNPTFFDTFTSAYLAIVLVMGLATGLCMIYTYSRLYLVSRRHRHQAAHQPGVYSLLGAIKGGDPNNTQYPAFSLLVMIGYTNSLLNPLIYARKIEEIRGLFKKIGHFRYREAAPTGSNPDNSVLPLSRKHSETPRS